MIRSNRYTIDFAFYRRCTGMLRVAFFLAAIAQMPLAAALAEVPATKRVSDSTRQAPAPTAAAGIRDGQLTDQTSQSAPAPGPIALGSMEQAIRSAPTTNVSWNVIEPSRSIWASLEYLAVWVSGSHVPSPATSRPIGTPQAPSGMPGLPAATMLSGDQGLNADMRSGGRITAGVWLIDDAIGVEASFFALQPESTHFSAAAFPGAR
jgi:hypothetical protein